MLVIFFRFLASLPSLYPQLQRLAADTPGRPLLLPPQGLDPGNDVRAELGGIEPWPASASMKTWFVFSTVSGHPPCHAGASDTELPSHVGLEHTVVEMTVHHAQSAGRGQRCISVGLVRALS